MRYSNILSWRRQKPAIDGLVTGYFFLHALATPLSSLAVYLDCSLALNPQPALKQYLQEAMNCVKHLHELWRLAKHPDLDEDSHSYFYIKPAIQEVRYLLRSFYNSKVWLSIQINCKETISLKGNRFFFQEALLCALKNSLEAYSDEQNKIVKLWVNTKNNKLKLTIMDRGFGMSWWQQKLVFSDGYSSKNNHFGVGLSWVKSVVENYFQGEVNLVSKKHRGTVMEWSLPLSDNNQNLE